MSSRDETPPEVEATLTRLTSHKNVRGVLILARSTGILIRFAGTLFSTPASTTTTTTSTTTNSTTTPILSNAESDKTETVPTAVLINPTALRYAKLAQRLVENVGEEIGDCEKGDELKFLRIRTKKHELMITPDSLYILVVIQDPSI